MDWCGVLVMFWFSLWCYLDFVWVWMCCFFMMVFIVFVMSYFYFMILGWFGIDDFIEIVGV